MCVVEASFVVHVTIPRYCTWRGLRHRVRVYRGNNGSVTTAQGPGRYPTPFPKLSECHKEASGCTTPCGTRHLVIQVVWRLIRGEIRYQLSSGNRHQLHADEFAYARVAMVSLSDRQGYVSPFPKGLIRPKLSRRGVKAWYTPLGSDISERS